MSVAFVRFLTVGMLATAVHIVTVSALVELARVSAVLASIPAFVLAVLISYWVNRRWTFTAGRHAMQAPRYLAVALGGLALNVAIVAVTVKVLSLSYWAAMAVVLAAVPLMSFVLNRRWTFASRGNR